jgi:hypothetical protein
MKATRLIALLLLAVAAQGASATTLWLKDGAGQICKNTGSANPGEVIGLGSLTGDVLTMTISNPAATAPTTGNCKDILKTNGTNIVFTGRVTPQNLPIHMWKPGTKGAMECLDQGNNLSGVIGTLSVTLANGQQYTLGLGGGYTDGCNMQTQTKITADGLPVFTRIATIRRVGGEGKVFSGSYHIFNELNRIPEPGSLLLLAAGAASLILIGLQRRRLVKQAQS